MNPLSGCQPWHGNEKANQIEAGRTDRRLCYLCGEGQLAHPGREGDLGAELLPCRVVVEVLGGEGQLITWQKLQPISSGHRTFPSGKARALAGPRRVLRQERIKLSGQAGDPPERPPRSATGRMRLPLWWSDRVPDPASVQPEPASVTPNTVNLAIAGPQRTHFAPRVQIRLRRGCCSHSRWNVSMHGRRHCANGPPSSFSSPVSRYRHPPSHPMGNSSRLDLHAHLLLSR